MICVTFTVSIVKVLHHHDGNQTVISSCDMIRICFRPKQEHGCHLIALRSSALASRGVHSFMKQRPPADQSNVLRWSAGVPGGGSGGVSGATTSGSGGPPCLPISQRMAAAAGTSAGATVCAIRPRGALSSRLTANVRCTPQAAPL